MTTKVEQLTPGAKPSTLQNFKNFMKVGSDRLKEKVVFHLFSLAIFSLKNSQVLTQLAK
jgi:hypothetical protein